MAGYTTLPTPINPLLVLLRFHHCGMACKEFSEVEAVVRKRKVDASFAVNFMIAILLSLGVDIVSLNHAGGVDLQN